MSNNPIKCMSCSKWCCSSPTLKTPLQRAKSPDASLCQICLERINLRPISQAAAVAIATMKGDTLIFSRLCDRRVRIWTPERKSDMTQEQFDAMKRRCGKRVCDLFAASIEGDRRSSKVRKTQQEAWNQLDRETGGYLTELYEGIPK